VQLPTRQSERDEAREDERLRLFRLLAVSQQFFRDALKRPEGELARAYLSRRGLAPETIERFGLGFAPASRSALKEYLAAAGFTQHEMAASGMLIAGDDIPVSYDRFRNRVTFPITDLKERVIAFGGRALDPDAPAKYLNSPETPLFHKGHVLYNAARARNAAHDKGRLIAVEGYMDVVALGEAGLAEAVAPLGTALTEDQVKLMWRFVPEPILCFDGDSAGRKAAYRAVDTVLPHLRPGQSVSFAVLPDGLDPDDLIRQQGAAAMDAILTRARPLAEILFEREWNAGDWSTPERRARLEQRIRELVASIGDPAVRNQYERDMRNKLFTLHRGNAGSTQGGDAARKFGYAARRGFMGKGTQNFLGPGGTAFLPPAKHAQHAAASSALRRSPLVAGADAAPPYREVLLLRTLLNHPWLIDEQAEVLAKLSLTSSVLDKLRRAILSAHALDIPLDSANLRSQLDGLGVGPLVELVDRSITHRSDRFAEAAAERHEVEIGWRHTLAMHEQHVDLRQALASAEREWSQFGNETALARICEIQRQIASVNAHAGLEGGLHTDDDDR